MTEDSRSLRAPVRVLRDSVARRIAAGEVIDRPASVLRELLDNAIDAKSGEIAVYIEGGGVQRVRVVDDGFGMEEEDLRLCWLSHATSKIETEDDLYRIRSLGFRGEALSSIATVARTEITSRTNRSDTAYRLSVHGGELLSLEPCTGKQGTIADVSDLFFSVPARRRFMKRPSAETSACRAIFLEKALPFPETAFKFFTDGSLRQFLPASGLKERIAAAYPGDIDLRLFHELYGSGDGFSLHIAAVSPDLFRHDRKFIQTYVNRRRIWEFSLVQGIEYAFGEYLPGGRFPLCFVFVDISPELVDFNIHPAKKEAKIKNLADIRRRLTEVLSSFLRNYSRKTSAVQGTQTLLPEVQGLTGIPGGPGPSDRLGNPGEDSRKGYFRDSAFFSRSSLPQDLRLKEGIPSSAYRGQEKPGEAGGGESQPPDAYDFVYRGQIFSLFLIAEKTDRLFLVDQHAAHERILYERFAADTHPQGLLIPLDFETDPDEDAVVEENLPALEALGIRMEKTRECCWSVTAVPESYRGAESDVAEAASSRYEAAGGLKKELFATMACRMAVKDGDAVDPATACEIIRKAFLLEVPRCPHGRPLWFEISREDLFRGVGRIV